MTLTLNQHWSNIHTAHRLIILDICAKLFVNPTRGSKDIERTGKSEGRSDRLPDGWTKRQLYVLPWRSIHIVAWE